MAASLSDRIQRLEGARARGRVFAPAPPGTLPSEHKKRQFEQLFKEIENARAQLRGEPPPHEIEPSEATPEDIADGWKTHDWLRDNWTRAGGGRLTEEEEEFLASMREELAR